MSSRLSSLVREKKVFNLDSAKSAGVLWEIDQRDTFERLQIELSLAGLTVDSLCYVSAKKGVLPDEVKGFTRKQTSWSEVPESGLAEDFIRQKFDILIDLTGQQYFPIVYLTALSEAAFKIGYAGNSVNYFDLNIEFSEQPEPNLLADQILYYLKRINKTTIE
ncbi:MAG: hypothetical protein JNK09_19825 [Prolixibacteraceae bacterium]|nr:hypothetical protein [Prolixibacteraceae bacterium]